MATYEITDSVLRRHHEQHLSVGGSPVADALDRTAVDAHASAVGVMSAAGETVSAAAANVADAGSSAVSATTAAATAATGAAAAGAASAASEGSGLLKKLLPIILLVALAFIIMKFFF